MLPRKFWIHEITDEPREETQIRKDLVVQRFQTELKLLEKRLPRYESKIRKMDESMEIAFQEETSDQVQNFLVNLWKKDTEKEEIKSVEIWSGKETWFHTYAVKYCKEKNYIKEKRNNTTHPTRKTNKPATKNQSLSYSDVLKRGVKRPIHQGQSEENDLYDQCNEHSKEGKTGLNPRRPRCGRHLNNHSNTYPQRENDDFHHQGQQSFGKLNPRFEESTWSRNRSRKHNIRNNETYHNLNYYRHQKNRYR